MSHKNILDKYNFSFPHELIANRPATPRDAAQLLVYSKKDRKVSFDVFKNLPKYLPKGAVLVFNQTKVLPARLTLTRPTGGKVRILYIARGQKLIKAISEKVLKEGERLSLGRALFFVVEKKDGQFYFLKPSFPAAGIIHLLERYGDVPTPLYMKNIPFSKARLKKEYQTVFAKEPGSVAAPTASLHFTKPLLAAVRKRGCEIVFVTLHVGLGTFAPVSEQQLKSGRLHEEYYKVSRAAARAISRAKKEGRPIIAVGTTVVRTLESAADANGNIRNLSGNTDLFIREGYKFRIIDGLVTNFHVPGSSLLMLVSAFAGRKEVSELYRKAIARKFRLFSFGDGMLVLNSETPNPNSQYQRM